ncbi:Glycopeptide antibiotics resistance protein [Paenibacillus macquariensis]|uniref:Glycopeptide antibiotics resistance protein n=2 Tax=Paenibacillus macquariensis TaxID=948756 RepID=A0ABY1KAV8_9BACL|nr:Glycopeptide antibiotics resistance protein [Paenibacillus macquariensis]
MGMDTSQEGRGYGMKRMKLMNGIIVPILFAVYMYVLIKVILFKFGTIDVTFLQGQMQRNLRNPENIIERLQSGNLSPLKEILGNMYHLSGHGLINLVGNIAIFIPFGIFLLLMSRNHKMSFISVFILSLGLSLSLECAQVLFQIGTFDVDDLILNVSGGLIGFVIFKICVMFKRNESKVTQG